jgi:hypothetical protein
MSQVPRAEEGGLRKPLQHLRSILIPGETLDAWAVQSRFYALTHRRLLVGATSGRLISLTRGLLGGFDVEDMRWQDLEDVKLHVGILAAKLMVHAGRPSDLATQSGQGGRVLTFEGLRKHQAEAVYRICQAQDQAWREKRRVRDLEELRARSGGITTSMGAGLGAAAVAGVQSEAVRRLEDAKKMLDERLITDAEYEAIKAKILSS